MTTRLLACVGRRDWGNSNELQQQEEQPHCIETAGETEQPSHATSGFTVGAGKLSPHVTRPQIGQNKEGY